MPKAGDLSNWARQGVLLLNTALTVEAGLAGAHLKYGWAELVDEAIRPFPSVRQRWCFCSGAALPEARCPGRTARSIS